jgi:hypothetical protein
MLHIARLTSSWIVRAGHGVAKPPNNPLAGQSGAGTNAGVCSQHSPAAQVQTQLAKNARMRVGIDKCR